MRGRTFRPAFRFPRSPARSGFAVDPLPLDLFTATRATHEDVPGTKIQFKTDVATIGKISAGDITGFPA